MRKKRNLFSLRLVVSLMMILTTTLFLPKEASASSSIKLMVDGKDITSSAAPLIVNDRTLVPVRVVAEELGAEVIWNNEDRTVKIIKDDSSMLLRIDSYLVEYSNDVTSSYNLSDVPAQIIKGLNLTYVPLRVISNGLGVGIDWDNSTRTVSVDSHKSSSIVPFSDMKISTLKNGQVITGTTNLQSVLPSTLPKGASEIKYLLLNDDNAKGNVIARGSDLKASYEWKPSMEDNGQKILVAAIYDSNGKYLCGDAIPVTVGIIPTVSLNGIMENQVVNSSTVLSTNSNFQASYVQYEMKNALTGKVVYTSPKWDPEGTFTMVPYMEDNDGLIIRTIAYDSNDQPYSSQSITIGVNVTPEYSLKGVSDYQTIDNTVTLYASTNFNVSEIEYVLRDTKTKVEKTLNKVSYGSYKYFPSIEDAGSKELFVRIKDKTGNTYTSKPVYVTIPDYPKILLQGAGPNQIVTGTMKLKVLSNVQLKNIKFMLYNPLTNKEYTIAQGSDYLAEYTYTPLKAAEGAWKMRAVATLNSGKTISTEQVPITIYLGSTYGPKPVIEKSKFLDLASKLAVETKGKTGMSAALQTAQAILETGWGQSVPVDKYTGQISYNLFGIKGTGTAGSVTSNTWEEYNGVSYRIDAEFRAYKSVNESWDDHNNLLLTKERYGIYRDVMHDSTKGAWALKRAGYATDSSYPTKLMEIISQYNLKKLDETGI